MGLIGLIRCEEGEDRSLRALPWLVPLCRPEHCGGVNSAVPSPTPGGGTLYRDWSCLGVARARALSPDSEVSVEGPEIKGTSPHPY